MLDSQTSRAALEPRPEPHWERLRRGVSLGYRAGPSTWIARWWQGDSYAYCPLGSTMEVPYESAKDHALKLAGGASVLSSAKARRGLWSRRRIVTESLRPLKAARGMYVYFLVDGSEIIYVGCTTNPFSRLEKQMRAHPDARIAVVACESREAALELESRYIAKLNPRLNVAGRTS